MGTLTLLTHREKAQRVSRHICAFKTGKTVITPLLCLLPRWWVGIFYDKVFMVRSYKSTPNTALTISLEQLRKLNKVV